MGTLQRNMLVSILGLMSSQIAPSIALQAETIRPTSTAQPSQGLGRYVGHVKVWAYGATRTLALYRALKFFNRSKYQPHQGKRECARRVA